MSNPKDKIDPKVIFDYCKHYTDKKKTYSDGNRNNYIHLLACNCNRRGLTLEHCIGYATEIFDLSKDEIKIAIESAYKNHPNEFAKFANIANLQTENEDDPKEDYLKTTPSIPGEIYNALPEIFKEGARAFTDNRKRDVFFTGALSIISGCLPNVTGVYFNERVFPHLFTFIIAPAASGKGVLKNAKRLADKYHQKILQESKDAQKKYEVELAQLKHLEHSKKKGEPMPEKPEPPPFKIIIIPADCSKARMVEHLKANDGKGIICETEADTMSGANKQDWGDYSTILRAAFHHETVSSSRKTNNQYDEINDTCLAVALTGTPSQAPKLIASAEDGLFSRFLFYAYKNNILWQDPSPYNNSIIYNDHFDALSTQVLEMVNFLENYPTVVELKGEQWQIINTEFPAMLAEVVTFTGEDAAGVVYRLGLILFRLCMIFTAMRKFENGDTTMTIICTDEDFNAALKIVQIYLEHSLLMFNNLPKQSEATQFKTGDSKRKFFDALPQEFTRQQAVETGKQFQLSSRTVDDVLCNAIGKALEKFKAGHYRKI